MREAVTGFGVFTIVFVILLCIQLPWKGHHTFSLANTSKNAILKLKHWGFHVPLDRDVCDQNLKEFKSAMGPVPFWISEGTALGAIREGDFILHDDDVDIGMWCSDLQQFNEEVIPELKRKGFTLDWDLQNGTFMSFSRNWERLDVDVVSPDGECMAARTAAANCGTCDCIIPYLQNMYPITL